MTWASLTRDIEMQRDKAQCEASNENYDIAWAQDNEKVHSLLTTFMMWASLTRDVEMQRDKELWEVWAHDDEKLNSMLLKFMTLASLARGVEMQRDKQTCDASNENYNVAWAQDDEKVHSLLTNFMTWASLTRDVEMQRDKQLCEASNENILMPWDVQFCAGDLKLVHRTEPMLGHGDYRFEPEHKPAMSGKDTKNIKSRFGLPREKVRKFMSLLKPRPMHWRTTPPETYV
mmetsp:Transcript_8796/g.18946  ORF Transcript_8796/g.18946 Transcript_8796/m.18946 type:complete len:231 (+) Transcript_8796:584-1276(+)